MKIRVMDAMSAISAEDWDACANPDPARWNPFLTHTFLAALEESGCVARRTGWMPQHLLLEDDTDAVVGAMPLYLKSHSRGEYVFDHGWANAYESAGGSYYPKLQSCVPFTPVAGQRLLTRTIAGNRAVAEEALLGGAMELMRLHGASSLHVTFVTEQEWTAHGHAPILRRTDQQFHWLNEGYGRYDDFLETLSSRKRKAIRRERREATVGIEIEHLTGSAITEAHWDAFFAFYQDTGNRKWGSPYLNRRFFSLIGERMAAQTLLIMCKRAGRYVAGALNFIGGDALYGRYWGAIEHHPFLHFETCYHQAIDFAIGRGLARVEAGAQGEHKLARGYLPQTTYSLHHLAHPGLRKAVADFLEQERQAVAEEARILTELGPFKKSTCEDGTP
jgi:uncharacterized protein